MSTKDFPGSEPPSPDLADITRQRVSAGRNPGYCGSVFKDRYHIGNELGRGAIGVVYLAEDRQLHSKAVVVKILLDESFQNQWFRKKFDQEIEALSRVDHPGVVQVLDSGVTTDNRPFLVMQFVSGGTLRSMIKHEGMDFDLAARVLRQAGQALSAAHAQGIVHCDVKPENIMLQNLGEGEYQVKIVDFGVAKVQNSQVGSSFAATSVAGTAFYMAPEQYAGKPGTSSDIFALGVIAYEMLTGRRPFNPPSAAFILDTIREGVRIRPTDLRPEIPHAAQEIILKALSYDPGSRPERARDFGDLLAQALTGDSELSLHPGVSTQPQRGHSTTAIRINSKVKAPLYALAIAALAILIWQVFIKRPVGSQQVLQNSKILKLTEDGKAGLAVISPEGKYVGYTATDGDKQSLWLRQISPSSNIQIVPPREVRYEGLTFSGDGSYLYYVERSKGQEVRYLYRIAALGGSPMKLAEDVDSAITFSPDGKKFAFRRESEEETSLILANSGGGGEQQLVSVKKPDIIRYPVWSPDGATIACAAQRFAGGLHWEATGFRVADGSEGPLTAKRWQFISGLAWLPDGKGLILGGKEENSGSAQEQIWQLSLPEGDLRRITNDLNRYEGVSMAGSTALVTVQKTVDSNLWVLADGGAGRATQITEGTARFNEPAWTPDGRIVCMSYAGGSQELWVMDSDGGNRKQLTSDGGVDIFPDVSPDGKYIVFASDRANSKTLNIWRMTIDGGLPKQLTSGGGEYYPHCTPDGRWVLYTPWNDSQRPSVWKVLLESGDPIQVNDTISYSPVVAPKGNLIAVLYAEQRGAPRRMAIMPVDGGIPLKVFDVEGITEDTYRWRADSQGLYYILNQRGVANIWYQTVSAGPPKQITSFTSGLIHYFDCSKDGKLTCARGKETTDVILMKDQGITQGK
ncbi:MAG TPA: protein kinase [Blastocatellia bacterium]|nr:protein kinase [Blastocatellia bacterium]